MSIYLSASGERHGVVMMKLLHHKHLIDTHVQEELTLAGLGGTVLQRSQHFEKALKDDEVEEGLPDRCMRHRKA